MSVLTSETPCHGLRPTNYLDRDGLGTSTANSPCGRSGRHRATLHLDFMLLLMQGALVLAIKDYKGGVLIISHNKDGAVEWIQKRVTRP